MAKSTLPLTNTEIKNAKPKEKDYKLFDGGGLFLLVATTGGKRWRLKFRFNNKENIIALGTYPSLSLKDVREIRDNYKSMIAKGINPVEEKKSKLEKIKFEERKKENTFFKVSQEWHQNYKTEVSENYHIKLDRALENYLYPYIKNKPIEEITRLDIIEILQGLKNRGLIDTASRVFMLYNTQKKSNSFL